MAITRLEQMIEAVKSRPAKRLVAAYANDSHTIEAVHEAVQKGIVTGILVGDETVIRQHCADMNIPAETFRIVHEPVEQKAAAKAVELIHLGEADILMKGLVSTDKYMRAILDKEKGLVPPKGILTHVTVMENARYPKLIICSDVAIIPLPDLAQKAAMIGFMTQVASRLGIEKPKVAVVGASEQVLPKVPSSVEATVLAKMAERGQIKGCVVDGPLSIDAALDPESAQIKKIGGEVAGQADCLLFPNIEAGNVFYKTNTKLAGAELGAIVAGARCPAILSSRGDSALTKLYSIALAALTA